ncbi:NAD-dependent epimerase/dehydratase family protein [Plastoroseomonas arctica]|uniref:NAD(P)-dependent oxidoreductase n=1 Tax=Plastoroseomonas arctica TaxID=1509237 RepID=A0AAF1KUA4_9PROT|nr:NAD(P)-dependent oxidoreductase [Plastoroseomonas arctica]MBR0655827.1 NAD(P)-dependent oxidoreductase [Plastoroseomonas arctica]
MRLFLTGAAGFVGAATLARAIAAGHEVWAPIRPGEPAPRLAALRGRFIHREVDLRDADALAALLAEARADCVIHCAWSGVGNAQRFDRRQITDNVEASCTLVEAAAAAGIGGFVGMGSQGEYGAGNPMREDGLPTPTTLYGAAKVASLFLTRQLAAQSGMRHAWLRLFSTYGPQDNDGWLIPMLITEMLAGRRPKTTLGTQRWDWLHVDDVADALLAAATAQAEGVFNLGSGEAIAVRRVVEMIRDLAAPGMELVFGEIPFRPDQVMHMQADTTRLRAATGWSPRLAMREGLEGTIAWYREARG